MLNSAKGSDCGLVNVNIPTNGAEIGGAFGKSVILLCSNKYPLEKRNTLKAQEKFNNSVHRERATNLYFGIHVLLITKNTFYFEWCYC